MLEILPLVWPNGCSFERAIFLRGAEQYDPTRHTCNDPALQGEPCLTKACGCGRFAELLPKHRIGLTGVVALVTVGKILR
jgi:hypothetical protein